MERSILLQQTMRHIRKKKKQKEWCLAPFGIVGLETAFPLLYTHFVEKGILSLEQLIDLLTIKPAETFGLTHWKVRNRKYG